MQTMLIVRDEAAGLAGPGLSGQGTSSCLRLISRAPLRRTGSKKRRILAIAARSRPAFAAIDKRADPEAVVSTTWSTSTIGLRMRSRSRTSPVRLAVVDRFRAQPLPAFRRRRARLRRRFESQTIGRLAGCGGRIMPAREISVFDPQVPHPGKAGLSVREQLRKSRKFWRSNLSRCEVDPVLSHADRERLTELFRMHSLGHSASTPDILRRSSSC
jgi:hypothetical protein